MLLVTAVVVSWPRLGPQSTGYQQARFLREIEITVDGVMPWQEDDSWKDVGSNAGAGKEHLLAKSALKSTCLIIS